MIPDTLRIKHDFDGQAVEDSRTVSQNALNLVSIYPMSLHWSTLSGKRANFYTYLATAQKSKDAVVPIHTEEELHLFNSSVSLNGNWFSPSGAPYFEGMETQWSAKADGKNIFYKMHEHLKSHYKKWTDKSRKRRI